MTQRTARMDLEWEKEDTGDYYAAALPDIPGYPNPKGGPYHAVVSEDTVTTSGGWLLYIALRPGVDLYEQDFGIQPTETAEEMMQAVDNLSVEDIVDALEANGKEPWGNDDTVAARHASLGLEWERTGNGEWAKYLPAIPGYPGTQTEGNAQVIVQPTVDGFGFDIFILLSAGVDYIHLDNRDFGIPDTDTAEEMMAAVDNLSLRDIADMLDDMGYGPIDNPTASRHAAKRSAHMDLNWWQTSAGMWAADLPAIPGYPTPGGGHYHVGLYDIVNDDHEIIGYGFSLNIVGPTGAVTLWNDDFGFGYADTEEEAMQEVESLSPEEIAQAAADKGVQPWADVTASREGKHMIRKATRRIASLDLDWEETTDTFGDPLYKAVLPAIPGYPYSGDGNSTVSIGVDGFDSTDETYIWWMDIQVGKNDNVRFGDYELTGMGSYPLDYQMGYLDGLSVEWIADKLAEKGYPPEED